MGDRLVELVRTIPLAGKWELAMEALRSGAIVMALGSALLSTHLVRAQEAETPARVTVDFSKSLGPRVQAERNNNLSRATSFAGERDDDVRFYNEQGLHGSIYRVWVDANLIFDRATGRYDYAVVDDYLADASRLSDNLLVVMDTRVEIRDGRESPEQIKPVITTIMRELKRRFPNIRYIEAFNEPDHNLAKVITPEGLYDYYRVYYEAVNQVNRDLRPAKPLELGAAGYMQFNEPWLRAFLDRYKADRSAAKRLDFISFHDYGEFPPGDGDKAGPRAYHFYKGDPSEISGQRAKLEADLRQRGLPTTIPSFITELGIYPGPSFDNPQDPRPDYLIGAAGVTSLLYWLMEQPRTVPFNWVLRHFGEERKDQLITRAQDGRPMPVKASDGKPVPTGLFTPYGNAMLMMSKLKGERVAANSTALAKGKGVYAIATKDGSGAAVMLWNYQHTDSRSYSVTLDLGRLPPSLRGKRLKERVFRIDDKVSNYWANPATANLQQVSEVVTPSSQARTLNAVLSPNALLLVVLEAD